MKAIYSFTLSPRVIKFLDLLSELSGLSRSSVLEGIIEFASLHIELRQDFVKVPLPEEFLREHGANPKVVGIS